MPRWSYASIRHQVFTDLLASELVSLMRLLYACDAYSIVTTSNQSRMTSGFEPDFRPRSLTFFLPCIYIA
jgi:hypothetical protein